MGATRSTSSELPKNMQQLILILLPHSWRHRAWAGSRVTQVPHVHASVGRLPDLLHQYTYSSMVRDVQLGPDGDTDTHVLTFVWDLPRHLQDALDL